MLLEKGVWHKPPVPLEDAVDFLMILPKDILSDIDKIIVSNAIEIPRK